MSGLNANRESTNSRITKMMSVQSISPVRGSSRLTGPCASSCARRGEAVSARSGIE